MKRIIHRINIGLTLTDLETSIQSMKSGKAPGLGGLPIEFYRTFKDELLPYLHQLLEYCHREGVIPPSWRDARLVLIHKEGKDRK